MGKYMLDGCSEYSPKNPSTDLLCAACRCHRNFHRKVAIFDLEMTEASGNYITGGQNIITPEEESLDLEVALPMLDAGREEERLNQLVAPAQPEKKQRRRKSKFTDEQVNQMRAFSEWLAWSTRDRTRAEEIKEFCAKMGISWTVFKTWLHNNKKHYGRGSSSKKNCLSSRDKI
ncbi:zinc-finger homeodomain protein 6-like [Rhodamnia argentea]|uniref:Zinc-finger homeodomain protein 6-like n=1 Tax=Rhodamnia argentea TaxID=178133 RepID=A0A8B8P2R2_9MYRT|nr:zinc-finger homeodomain protein 6-like [Rhodamnia argentea]